MIKPMPYHMKRMYAPLENGDPTEVAVFFSMLFGLAIFAYVMTKNRPKAP